MASEENVGTRRRVLVVALECLVVLLPVPSSLTPRRRRGERKLNCRLHCHHRACQAVSDAAFVFATDLNVSVER